MAHAASMRCSTTTPLGVWGGAERSMMVVAVGAPLGLPLSGGAAEPRARSHPLGCRLVGPGADFDEALAFAVLGLALDDDEGAGLDPDLEHLSNAGFALFLVLAGDVDVEGPGDGDAGPILCLRVLAPCAVGDCLLRQQEMLIGHALESVGP